MKLAVIFPEIVFHGIEDTREKRQEMYIVEG